MYLMARHDDDQFRVLEQIGGSLRPGKLVTRRDLHAHGVLDGRIDELVKQAVLEFLPPPVETSPEIPDRQRGVYSREPMYVALRDNGAQYTEPVPRGTVLSKSELVRRGWNAASHSQLVADKIFAVATPE